MSLLWPAAMLAHAAREGLRTVTMARVLRRLWPDVPFLFWQWDVPAGPSGAAQSTARGHGGPGDWRWLGDAGWLGTQGSQGAQDSLPVTAAQGGGGLTQRPDAITAGAGDTQGVGHQPSGTAGGTPATGDSQSPAPELPCPPALGVTAAPGLLPRSPPCHPALSTLHPVPSCPLAPRWGPQLLAWCSAGEESASLGMAVTRPLPGLAALEHTAVPAPAPAPQHSLSPLHTPTPAMPRWEQQPSCPGTAGQTRRLGADKPPAPFGLLPDVTRPPARHGTARLGTARLGTAQLGMAWHCPAWLGTAWHRPAWWGGLALLGMVWHYLAWFGTAWHISA